jgi:hypothetical protein
LYRRIVVPLDRGAAGAPAEWTTAINGVIILLPLPFSSLTRGMAQD